MHSANKIFRNYNLCELNSFKKLWGVVGRSVHCSIETASSPITFKVSAYLVKMQYVSTVHSWEILLWRTECAVY